MWYNKEILREWVGDKKELHLLSLGQLGTLTEQIDGAKCLCIVMSEDNKIVINFDFYKVYKPDYHRIIEKLVRCELFEYFLKIKKKYGAFTMWGNLLYTKQEWFDEDGTITLNATKYHKALLGKYGAFFIDFIRFDKEERGEKIDEIEKDDILQKIKLFFNIHKHIGVSCFLKEDLIPNIEHDVCCDFDEDNLIESISKLARNNKSILNGKIDVKDCIVMGYEIKNQKKSRNISILNNEWIDKEEENTKKWYEIGKLYNKLKTETGFRDLTENDLEQFVQMCRDFLYDNTLPRGVRMSRFEYIDKNLMKLSSYVKEMFIYLKYYNKLITPPTD